MENRSISLKDEDNHSNGESSSIVGEPPEFAKYGWVKVEVMKHASIYQKSTDIIRLRQSVSLTTLSNEDKFICEPCNEKERICMIKSNDEESHYIYLYETIFAQLGIRLPFSDFECSILRKINVAPSQLHPNSWAFIRAFSMICEYFGIIATEAKFFCFFKTYLGNKVGWASLTNQPRRKILEPYSQSYKEFKSKYFKVKYQEKCHDCFIDSSGGWKFPFYWTVKPRQISGTEYGTLSNNEKIEVDYLEKLPPLSCYKVISMKNNPSAFKMYMREMAPKLSQKDLVKIFIQRKGKQVDSSTPASAIDVDSSVTESGLVTQKGIPNDPDFVENDKNMIISSKLFSPQLKRKSQNISSSTKKVVEVEGSVAGNESEIHSLWNKCFGMIDSELAKEVDVSKYKKIEAGSAAHVIQVCSFRAAFLARSIEAYMQNMEKKMSELLMEKEKRCEDKKLLGKKVADFEKQEARIAKLEKALAISENKVSELCLERDTLKAEKNSLDIALQEEKDMNKVTIDSWIKKEAKWIEDNENLKEEALAQYEAGFARALKQVKILNPRIDLSGTGLFKEIRNGKLVEIDVSTLS